MTPPTNVEAYFSDLLAQYFGELWDGDLDSPTTSVVENSMDLLELQEFLESQIDIKLDIEALFACDTVGDILVSLGEQMNTCAKE